jgi:hypothetical protein
MLPVAHEKLKSHLTHVDPGYIQVNQNILNHLGQIEA